MPSRAYLQQRLPRGQLVSILPHTTDRYGRTVAEVFSDSNINLVMVEVGQAYPLRGPAATHIPATSAAAMPRITSMPKSGPAAAAMGCGRCKEVSLVPGTSAVGAPLPNPRWHHPRRAPLALQADRLLCPPPGVGAAGPHRSGR